jgi:hypothetical protein
MNKLLLIGLVLLLIPLGFATDFAQVDKNFTIWADVTKDGVFFPATNATITVIDPTNTIRLNDVEMDNYATGIFNLVYVFDQVGEWFGYVKFYNDTSMVAIASQSIIVREAEDNMIPEKYIFLIIIAMMTFLAFYLKNYAVLIASGIFFIVAPFVFNFNWGILGGSFEYLIFILIGLAVLYQGISELMSNRKAD